MYSPLCVSCSLVIPSSLISSLCNWEGKKSQIRQRTVHTDYNGNHMKDTAKFDIKAGYKVIFFSTIITLSGHWMRQPVSKVYLHSSVYDLRFNTARYVCKCAFPFRQRLKIARMRLCLFLFPTLPNNHTIIYAITSFKWPQGLILLLLDLDT